MSSSFKVREYKKDPPTEYIIGLIEKSDPDGLSLAIRIKEIEHYGFLYDKCKETINGDVQLWVLSVNNHHIIYAYLKETKEIWYLKAFNGDIEINLEDSRRRLEEMRT